MLQDLYLVCLFELGSDSPPKKELAATGSRFSGSQCSERWSMYEMNCLVINTLAGTITCPTYGRGKSSGLKGIC